VDENATGSVNFFVFFPPCDQSRRDAGVINIRRGLRRNRQFDGKAFVDNVLTVQA
jgi:hypothetical protein